MRHCSFSNPTWTCYKFMFRCSKKKRNNDKFYVSCYTVTYLAILCNGQCLVITNHRFAAAAQYHNKSIDLTADHFLLWLMEYLKCVDATIFGNKKNINYCSWISWNFASQTHGRSCFLRLHHAALFTEQYNMFLLSHCSREYFLKKKNSVVNWFYSHCSRECEQ
jgi:hypothetical protein